MGVAERIYFSGQKDKKETFSIMLSCDALVLNSSYEGFPHVLLEAMSMGLPVIARPVGGVPEIIQDGVNGILTQPCNTKMLQKNILKILTDTENTKRLVCNAKETAGQFSLKKMVERTETVLNIAKP